jgi:FAD/FMN-containing dehydrogenase
MSTTTALMHTARSEMPGFQGRLTVPTDPGYDEARKVYNAMIDRRPALIASCVDAADVAKVVSFAGDHELLLAVRGGGHNGGGLGRTAWFSTSRA